jgi:hypothetical protein
VIFFVDWVRWWVVYKNVSDEEVHETAMLSTDCSGVTLSADFAFYSTPLSPPEARASKDGSAVQASAVPPLKALPALPAKTIGDLPPFTTSDTVMPESSVAEARKLLALAEKADKTHEAGAAGMFDKEKEKSEAREGEKEKLDAEKKAKWTAVLQAVCDHFKPKRIFRVIASEGKALQAKYMMTRAMDEFHAVCLFDLTTNEIVIELDKENGFMKPNCLPFHMLTLACLLQGETLSIKIFEEIVELWEQIKAEANKDLNDNELATAVLVKPLKAHAGGAYIKYHALLFLNSKKCLCPLRGQLIRDWVASLKMEVKIYKIKYLKEIENEMNKALARLVANTTAGELAGNPSDEGDDVY